MPAAGMGLWQVGYKQAYANAGGLMPRAVNRPMWDDYSHGVIAC